MALDDGTIAGIIVGCVILFLIFMAICTLYYMGRKRRLEERQKHMFQKALQLRKLPEAPEDYQQQEEGNFEAAPGSPLSQASSAPPTPEAPVISMAPAMSSHYLAAMADYASPKINRLVFATRNPNTHKLAPQLETQLGERPLAPLAPVAVTIASPGSPAGTYYAAPQSYIVQSPAMATSAGTVVSSAPQSYIVHSSEMAALPGTMSSADAAQPFLYFNPMQPMQVQPMQMMQMSPVQMQTVQMPMQMQPMQMQMSPVQMMPQMVTQQMPTAMAMQGSPVQAVHVSQPTSPLHTVSRAGTVISPMHLGLSS